MNSTTQRDCGQKFRPNSAVERQHVLAALRFYFFLVKRVAPYTTCRNVLRTGVIPENFQLWHPMTAVVEFCEKKKINIVYFLLAQFSEWVRPNPYAPDYPTSQYIGVNKGCVRRYKAWQKRMDALEDARQKGVEQTQGWRVLDSLLSLRHDLSSVEDVFKDPFLVRLFPKEFIKHQPAFQRLLETHRNDPVSAVVLSDYLA